MKTLESLAFVFIGLLLAGCTTTTPVDSQARALCIRTFGTDAHCRVLWFPTSHVEAFTMAFLGNTGPQREIASAMESAKNKRVDLVVWTEQGGQSTFYIEQALRYVPRSERLAA